MIKEANDKILKDIVLRMVTRSIKDHKAWHLFRYKTGIDNINNVYRYFVKTRKETEVNNLCFCNTSDEIKNQLGEICGDRGVKIQDVLNDKSKTRYLQERIANWLNALLHETIEGLIPMKEVSKIGEDAYNYSCKRIFGEDFEDLLVNDIPVPESGNTFVVKDPDFKKLYDSYNTLITENYFTHLTNELKRIQQERMQRGIPYANPADMIHIADDLFDEIM